ncbi:hypothetical protein [Ferriphaselus sp. R-1]|uniref:hypothetical protein n=1 Tax=Ferriphaselus sp. R-1 TaxID=1485544 RepID=UPI0005535DB8|nr:hypothetical protein [Ferriphaselus sp. R-1]
MSDQEFKSAYAREKHGQFMLEIAKSILTSVFSALVGGGFAVKLISATDQLFMWAILLLGIGGIIAVGLMIAGLRQIDLARIQRGDTASAVETVSAGGNGLNISIHHDGKQTAIRIIQGGSHEKVD